MYCLLFDVYMRSFVLVRGAMGIFKVKSIID